MITNIQEMKKRLEEIKQQSNSWLSSSDGSYEACLHDNGYYSLYNNIKIIEELDQIQDSIAELEERQKVLMDKLYGEEQ